MESVVDGLSFWKGMTVWTKAERWGMRLEDHGPFTQAVKVSLRIWPRGDGAPEEGVCGGQSRGDKTGTAQETAAMQGQYLVAFSRAKEVEHRLDLCWKQQE